jgi:ligand-binding sensor domain-containing protein
MNSTPPVKFLLGLLALWTASAGANVAEYNARIWQSDEGLPLDAAMSVAQTHDGFLWVGTQAGLARFDGSHFTVFDKKNIPRMTSANVTGLFTARDGSLWITTRSGGVHQMKDGKFSHYGKSDGLAGNDCPGGIIEDSDGSLFMATMEGLSRFKNGRFTTIYPRQVRQMCQDPQGNFWFATPNGIDCWSNGTFVLHLGQTNGLPNPDVRAICCDRYGAIWFGVGDEVHRINHQSIEDVIRHKGPNHNPVTTLYQDGRGTYWAGTYSGLNRIIDGKFVPELNPEGLPYGTVSQIFEDREDNLWICARDGLVRLKPNRVLCYTQKQGLGNDNVSSVVEGRAGDMYAATWGGGLNRLNDGVFTTYSNEVSFPVLALGVCQDHAGHFWVGTDLNEGLFRLDGQRVQHFTDLGGAPVPPVRVVFEDRTTNLWVGTSRGLFQFRQGRLWPWGARQGLTRDVVRTIFQDHEGTLWIGTQAGLVRVRDGVVTRYTATNGLAHDYILSIFEDSQRTLWVTALGGGLIRFHDGEFITYTTRDGLFSDNISSVIEDDNGSLWMGCDRGIFRVSHKNLQEFDRGRMPALHCVSYGKTDGMMSKTCNSVAQPAACKSRDGHLWFATIKGLCMIDPAKEVFPPAPPPPVVIEELQTEQESVTAPQEMTRPIQLPPGRGQLEFHYAALAYRAPEENRYRYKLEGVDSTWVDAGRRQIAHYNNVYPGHYRFRVMACNSDGIWNETATSLAVALLPHFWQTWWFEPVLLALVAAGLAILYRIILLRRLEIERLRLRIAADLHDEIGSNLASIALLSQLGQKGEDDDRFQELSEIHRIALFTTNGIREIVWFINPDYDTMSEMVSRMREVAVQMLIGVAYTFECSPNWGAGKLSPDFRRNLFLIFKEILHNIVKHSRAARVEIALQETRGMLLLRVADNGRGFEATAAGRGNGLRNIRLRANQLGGLVEIARPEAGGAVVTVSVKVT